MGSESLVNGCDAGGDGVVACDRHADLRRCDIASLALPIAQDAAHESRESIFSRRPGVDCVLAAADLFVLSSQREGLSFSLLEAMASGLPVVVSDAPGNRDAVGDAGIVVALGE